MIYEVDLRSRKTGNSVECVLSTNDHDEAYKFAEKWNKDNIKDYNTNIDLNILIDGTDGVVAMVYETSKHLVHGIGKY